MRRFLLASSASAILMSPTRGRAQTRKAETAGRTPAPEANAAASTNKCAGLTELVITAQRRSENLQHLAMAVSAVSGAAFVSMGRSSGTAEFIYDLDRVEILKGPQGALYCRNATGGAIDVINHRADLDRYKGGASVEYGNHETVRRWRRYYSPGEKAALGMAGTYVTHDGYMKDCTDGQDDAGGRVTSRMELTSALSINVVADYRRGPLA